MPKDPVVPPHEFDRRSNEEQDDIDLTPVRMIQRLERKFDEHVIDDNRRQDAQVQTTTKLLTDNAQQTALLQSIDKQWSEEKAERKMRTEAARIELSQQKERRSKFVITVIAVVGPIIAAVIAAVIAYETGHKPAEGVVPAPEIHLEP